eukprot:SAG31_NODE_136_length_23089_cov_8.825924_10_plen_59_part_00
MYTHVHGCDIISKPISDSRSRAAQVTARAEETTPVVPGSSHRGGQGHHEGAHCNTLAQ